MNPVDSTLKHHFPKMLNIFPFERTEQNLLQENIISMRR